MAGAVMVAWLLSISFVCSVGNLLLGRLRRQREERARQQLIESSDRLLLEHGKRVAEVTALRELLRTIGLTVDLDWIATENGQPRHLHLSIHHADRPSESATVTH